MSDISENTYAPKELRRLADITLGNFDYWKKELDPRRKVSGYYDEDVLAWLVMKEAVIGCRFEVKLAKRFDWEYVFSACHELTEDFLKQGRFVFDLAKDEVWFLTQEDEDPSIRKNNRYAYVYMDEIYETFSTS